ncbi:MAG: DNA replication/repair protein RecF [Rhizobiales bacterium]|nr:DNA replication/repair protein RecF [Hyphomicrobiales bacterium]
MADIYPTRIRALKLSQFRNYTALSLDIEPRSAVLVGANGAGKTNLLEALSFLSPGRGLRRAVYSDVALSPEKDGTGDWAVSTRIDTAFGMTDIGTGYTGGSTSAPSAFTGLAPRSENDAERESEIGRRIRIDRANVKSAESLTEYLRVLWLTPAMDGLFTGPAGERRRFLDRLVLAHDPAHGRRVNAFDLAVRNRNRVLEQSFSNTSWLDAIETQVAELGVAISAARHETVSLLIAEIDQSHEAARHFPQAALAHEGLVDTLLSSGSATDTEDRYRVLLAQARRRDRAAGRTIDGPHRADFLVRHREKNMPARLCSTGEQKALLIGLILAHARLVAKIAGMTPIVLLDEVAAHLDATRRAALFDVLDSLGCQAFMTGTDAGLFEALSGRAQVFRVDHGKVDAQ